MTTEPLAERRNRPWTAVEDDPGRSEMARETDQEHRLAERGRHMTSDVQEAMAEARDELRSEGMERAQRMQEQADREAPQPDSLRETAERVARQRRSLLVSIAVALAAIVAMAIVLSRMNARPKTREEEIMERSREAFDRSREALDALVSRLNEVAER